MNKSGIEAAFRGSLGKGQVPLPISPDNLNSFSSRLLANLIEPESSQSVAVIIKKNVTLITMRCQKLPLW